MTIQLPGGNFFPHFPIFELGSCASRSATAITQFSAAFLRNQKKAYGPIIGPFRPGIRVEFSPPSPGSELRFCRSNPSRCQKCNAGVRSCIRGLAAGKGTPSECIATCPAESSSRGNDQRMSSTGLGPEPEPAAPPAGSAVCFSRSISLNWDLLFSQQVTPPHDHVTHSDFRLLPFLNRDLVEFSQTRYLEDFFPVPRFRKLTKCFRLNS